MENLKEASIQQIQPLRILGLNRQKPFNYPISNTHIAYLSQKHLILQKLKDHSQIILWSIPQPLGQNQIQIITGQTDIFQITKIIIVYRNQLKLSKFLKVLMIDQNGGLISSKHQQVGQLDFYQQIKQVRYVTQVKMAVFLIFIKKCKMSKILLLSALGSNVRFKQQIVLMQKIEWIHSFQKNKQSYLILISQKQTLVMQLQNLQVISRKSLPFIDKLKQQIQQQRIKQKQKIIYSQVNYSYKNISIGVLVTNLGFVYTYQVNINASQIIFNKIDINIKKQDFFKYQGITLKSNDKKQQQQIKNQRNFYQPKKASSIANKIVISFRNTSILAYITFSVHNHFKYTLKHKKMIYQGQNQNEKQSQYLLSQQPKQDLSIFDIRFSNDQCHCSIVKNYKNKQVILLIDIVTNFLDSNKNFILKKKTKKIAFQGAQNTYQKFKKVILVQLSLLTNFIFTVDQDYILAGYKIDVEKGSKTQSWAINIHGQPHSITAHPLMHQIVIVSPQRFLCYSYNQQQIFPFYLSSGTKFTCGSYSPLGNFLALGGNQFLILYDAYSLEIYRQQVLQMKSVSNIKFINIRGDALVQVNNNSLFFMYNSGPLVNFGTISSQISQNPYIYDTFHKIIVYQDSSKNSLNLLNGKLQVIEQIQQQFQNDHVTCLAHFPQIQHMIVGTQRGYLKVIEWGTKRINFSIYYQVKVHSSSIIMIKLSANFQHLIAFTSTGSICFCKIKYVDCTRLKHHVSGNLLRKNEMKPYLSHIVRLTESRKTQKQQKINQLKLYLQQIKDNKNIEAQTSEKQLMQQFENQKSNYCFEIQEDLIYSKQYNQKIFNKKKEIMNLKDIFKKKSENAEEEYRQKAKQIYDQRSNLQQQLKTLQNKLDLKKQKIYFQHNKKLQKQYQNLNKQYLKKQQQFDTKLSLISYEDFVKKTEYKQYLQNQSQKVISGQKLLLQQLIKQLQNLKQSNREFINQNRNLVVNNNFLWNKNRQINLRINDFDQQQQYIKKQYKQTEQGKTYIKQILQSKNKSFKQLQFRSRKFQNNNKTLNHDIKNVAYIHDYKYQEYQKFMQKWKHYQKLFDQLQQQLINKVQSNKKIDQQLLKTKQINRQLAIKHKNLNFKTFQQHRKIEQNNQQQKLKNLKANNIKNQSSLFKSTFQNISPINSFHNQNISKSILSKRSKQNYNFANQTQDSFYKSSLQQQKDHPITDDEILFKFQTKERSVEKLIKSNNIKKAYRNQYEMFIKKTNDQTTRLHDHLNRIRKENFQLTIKMKYLLSEIQKRKKQQNGQNTCLNIKSTISVHHLNSPKTQKYITTKHLTYFSNYSDIKKRQRQRCISKSKQKQKNSRTLHRSTKTPQSPYLKNKTQTQIVRIKSKGATYISLYQKIPQFITES